MRHDERALILAATGRDARLTEEILRRGQLSPHPCSSADELVREAEDGVGLLILAEEMLTGPARRRLLGLLKDQPSWSDLPIVVLASKGQSLGRLLMAFEGLGSVTILERPVQVATLLSAVQAALRARHRQYEVRDLLDRLQETDRRKDEFLAMLGHELRNPLGVLRTALELMEIGGDTEATRRRQLDRIDHQITHLTRMVDDLLDLSRVSRGKISLQCRRIDLRVVIEQAIDSCMDVLADRRDDLTIELPDAPIWIEGDPTRLEQVVCNLLKNAAKFTPRGKRIELEVRTRHGEAEIEVSDDGVGIDPMDLEGIFDSFTQAEKTLARSTGGLGLGLALTRQLVELHGGSVVARSEGLEKGSTFVVTLPELPAPEAVDEPTSEPVAAEPLPEITDPQARVLVVEDLQHAREALGELLTLAGYEVALAPDGEEGLRSALEDPPDIALVDIGLPGLDGYEVARRIRKAPLDGTYLVAMTGYGQDEDRDRALAAGFDRHLVKPVDPDALMELLRKHAGGNGEPREPQAVGS